MSEPKKFPTTLQTANLNTEKLLWLFGFRIDPDTEIPNLYTLIVYGEQEPPLVAGGQLVFFTRPEWHTSSHCKGQSSASLLLRLAG